MTDAAGSTPAHALGPPTDALGPLVHADAAPSSQDAGRCATDLLRWRWVTGEKSPA